MIAPTLNSSPARSTTLDHSQGGKNPSELKQGEQKLYSFYAPSLEAGDYTIKTEQKIDAVPSETPAKIENTKTLKSIQKFTIVAPRFTLPTGSIHSMYPAPGRAEPAKTLPHVVLNDPHLPWGRDALAEKKEPDVEQNQVPWLAVLVFTQEELQLGEKHLKRGSGIFPPGVSPPPLAPPPNITQNKTLAINMTISDLLAVMNTATPIRELSIKDEEALSATTDVIFLQSKLFTSLFTTYDEEGNPVDGQELADVSRYKFLAHARKVSTIGMVIDNSQHEAFFSVVISHRVGPLDLTQPTPVVVHLVSIEGVGKMKLPIADEFVALSSLHSWTYTCLPAHSMDTLYSFQHLGDTLGLLRPSKEIMDKLGKPGERIRQRLDDGYSLVRYITQTGEETVAFTRGPLTPTTVEYPLRPDWGISTFGTDLQIFDTELGVMDITYSSAWQLGKALALANHPFAAALSRVRTHILDEAMNRSKVDALIKQHPSTYKTRPQALQSLLEATAGLHRLLREERAAGRFSQAPPPIDTDDYSHGSDLIKYTFDKHCSDAAQKLSLGTNGNIFNEHNTPHSTDWKVVFSWILDQMYLINVPAHYLISDPTHLPPESLRFFHIDCNWVDAMIDGALSIANHMQCYDSKIRTVIKQMVNTYLETFHDRVELLPQIPTYGFLLRSDICSQFPDLVVEAAMPSHLLGAPILYHKNLDQGVMLCLFDRVPSSSEFESLTFTQPPHQQCFSAGDSLDESTFEMIYKHPYLNEVADEKTYLWNKVDIGKPVENRSSSGPPVFLWEDRGLNVRTLLFPAFAKAVFESNKKQVVEPFTDKNPGAAMVGIQLGSAIYKLQILLKKSMLVPTKTDRGLKMLGLLNLGAEPVGPPTTNQPNLPSSPIPECCCTWTPSPLAELVHLEPKIQPRSAGAPLFTYKVFSVRSPKKEKELLMTSIEQDLVFSIVLAHAGGDQMRLKKVVLDFPIGPANWNNPTLMTTYKGSVKMLSNLRFNALAQLNYNSVSVTLLPRTQTGDVVAANVDEMSFMMSGVNVHVYDNSNVSVKISPMESYCELENPIDRGFKVLLVPYSPVPES